MPENIALFSFSPGYNSWLKRYTDSEIFSPKNHKTARVISYDKKALCTYLENTCSHDTCCFETKRIVIKSPENSIFAFKETFFFFRPTTFRSDPKCVLLRVWINSNHIFYSGITHNVLSIFFNVLKNFLQRTLLIGNSQRIIAS